MFYCGFGTPKWAKSEKSAKKCTFPPFSHFLALGTNEEGRQPAPAGHTYVRRDRKIGSRTGPRTPRRPHAHTHAISPSRRKFKALAPARAEIREFKALAPARAGVRVYGKEVILLKRIPWGTHGAAARLLSPPHSNFVQYSRSDNNGFQV